MTSNDGELRVKRINEMIEGFSGLGTPMTTGEEEKYWQVFDFKRNQKFSLPVGTAVNFFREMCESIRDNGFMDDNGEPLYYYGECLGFTRPIRMNFAASIKKGPDGEGDEDDNRLKDIYRTIISCMAMALTRKFEKTTHGKEYRVCGVMYSTDVSSDVLDITVYFPYARVKESDFRDVFIPTFYSIVNEIVGDNLFNMFLGVNSVEDMISENTYTDTVPFFGCVVESDDYPKNKVEFWHLDNVPTSIDEILNAEIEQADDDYVSPADHYIFEREFSPKPKSVAQQTFWKSLIFTNSFWRHRLVLRSSPKPIEGTAPGPNHTRLSPYMRSVAERRSKVSQMSKEVTDKRIISDVVQHMIDSDEAEPDKSIPRANRNSIVKFMKCNMYMQEIQALINVFVLREKWFSIEKITDLPPIRVGHEGFYLTFDNLEFILGKLNPRRCEVTSQLEDIACVVYTMARTIDEKEEAKHRFVEFVRESNPPSFKTRGEDVGLNSMFERQVKRAVKGRLTFWSLLNMFAEDDPLYYHLWWKYICDYYILHALDSEMASFPVARAMALPLIGKFIHTTGDAKQTWWKYTGTCFLNIHDTQSIELELTTTFVRLIQCVESRYGNIAAGFSSKKVSFSVLRDRINESAFRFGIVKDLGNVFLRDNRLLHFSQGTDPEYADFFATINYVYQFSDGEMRRRPGHWEDFLTKKFDVIDERLDVYSDSRCQFILDWVHKMLRDPPTEREFLKNLGSFIRGFNRDKRFDVWYGYGNGGKSKFMDAVSSTLGLTEGYAFKLPLESMMEGAKRTAGAADPAVDQGRGAFLAVLDEPKKGMKFDAAKIKSNTGNDPIYNRTLFSKGGTFRPMYKTVLLGNVLPKADYDAAMKIRFWVWHFKGRFEEAHLCPPTPAEQERLGVYPLDKDLDTKLPEYRPAMFAVLLHYFKLYHKEGVVRTEGIKRATDMFWHSANDVICFMHDQTVQLKELDTYVQIDELYDSFRRWFMSRNNGDRVMTKILFADELQAIYTTQDIKAQGGLAGVRLRDGA